MLRLATGIGTREFFDEAHDSASKGSGAYYSAHRSDLFAMRTRLADPCRRRSRARISAKLSAISTWAGGALTNAVSSTTVPGTNAAVSGCAGVRESSFRFAAVGDEGNPCATRQGTCSRGLRPWNGNSAT